MSNAYVRKYLVIGLAGIPDVLSALLRDLPPGDPRWDARPHADRFTLREILAHVAEWDGIWLDRVRRIKTEAIPVLPDIDEGQIAIDHDYAHQDPTENLLRLTNTRANLVHELKGLPDSAWDRLGVRPPYGEITLESLCVMVLGHDGYHTQQVAEWVRK